jgi:hypothetical protein
MQCELKQDAVVSSRTRFLHVIAIVSKRIPWSVQARHSPWNASAIRTWHLPPVASYSLSRCRKYTSSRPRKSSTVTAFARVFSVFLSSPLGTCPVAALFGPVAGGGGVGQDEHHVINKIIMIQPTYTRCYRKAVASHRGHKIGKATASSTRWSTRELHVYVFLMCQSKMICAHTSFLPTIQISSPWI